MNISRILGIILFVIGVVFLVFGVNASNGVVDRLSEATTGHFTEHTLWYIIGGIAMIVGGLVIFLRGGCKS